MKAEVLCIGTELLLGDTINSNAAYISSGLSKVGIDCFYHSAVGDNSSRIKKVLDAALNRVDILIITGGLGPTDDDITMQAIADFFNKPLLFNEDSYKLIENFFNSGNREVPEKAKKQAYFPEGAKIISNPVGTAPGMIWEIEQNNEKKIIITFPGVPDELYKMWEAAEKYLNQYSEYVIEKRFLKFFGIPEGTLGEKIKDLMESSNPTVAPLVSEGQPNVRIAAKAKNSADAKKLIDEMQRKILDRIGEYFWGFDDDTLEGIVGKLLSDKKLTVSTAESCTGGLISSRLTDVSGSSDYIKLNFVTYSNEAKVNMLGVDPELIENHDAVSEPVAKAMAEGARKKANADIGLSITGIAGPTGGTPAKPVGIVYIGISDEQNTEVYKVNINPNFDRTTIKHRASGFALNYLRIFIKKYAYNSN